MRYRAIAPPPAEGGTIDHEVYLVGEAGRGYVLISRHFRLTISADGSRVKSIEPSAVGCVRIPSTSKDDRDYALATHFLTCAPTAFHVYLSHLTKRHLYVGTSVGTWRVEAGRITFVSRRAKPCAASQLPDTENHWVAVPRTSASDGADYGIAFHYFDKAAGFTARSDGSARIDENGEFRWVQRQPEHFSVVVRMRGVPFAHILSDKELAQLGLDPAPAWLAVYRDTSDPATQRVRRGSALNGMGESRLALRYLIAAQRERADAPRLAFELAYSYNALKIHDLAIETAAAAFAIDPSDWATCKELAYARLNSSEFEEAANTYSRCLSLLSEGDGEVKSEIAINLAAAYKGLGALELCHTWLGRAGEWVPASSPQRETIDRAKATPGLCGK